VAATRDVAIDFSTVAGKPSRQDLPFVNPSDDLWQYKVTLTGDSSFSAPNRFSVKANSQGALALSFATHRIGQYTAEMVVVNTT
jgi:hypothetical protein